MSWRIGPWRSVGTIQMLPSPPFGRPESCDMAMNPMAAFRVPMNWKTWATLIPRTSRSWTGSQNPSRSRVSCEATPYGATSGFAIAILASPRVPRACAPPASTRPGSALHRTIRPSA